MKNVAIQEYLGVTSIAEIGCVIEIKAKAPEM